jgi:hypothetical protein
MGEGIRTYYSMQQIELTLSTAQRYYGEKKPNITAMQRSKRRGTQDTVNSNSGEGSATYRHEKDSVKSSTIRVGPV